MARGKFGKIVPRFSEIVKIDGNNVIDADGDVFDRNLVVSMEKHGLKGYEVFPFDDAVLAPLVDVHLVFDVILGNVVVVHHGRAIRRQCIIGYDCISCRSGSHRHNNQRGHQPEGDIVL